MVKMKSVMLFGEKIDICGASDDPYFQNIEAFVSETEPLQRFVRQYIPNGLILDIGGNIGLTSIAMSLVNPNSHIIAFEPSPTNAGYFLENTKNRPKIELIQAGAGSKYDSLNFVSSHAGANSHVATSEYQYANHPDFRPILVPIVTVDGFMSDKGLSERVSLIKIDTEGYEPHVLVGAAAIIERDRPYIWMEFNSVCLTVAHGYSPMAFAKSLFDCFEVFRMVDLNLVPISDPGKLVHDNIIHQGSIEDIILKPRLNVKMHDVEQMTLPRSAYQELQELRAKLTAN